MDKKIIANIKALGIDMIEKAESGLPGIVLGAAPLLYTLFSKHMCINKEDAAWMNRDRFVLSAGHGSALLYATFYMAGLGYSLDDLKGFRQLGCKTTGHPEYGVSPFVEATTGPLGQGIAMATGMALGEKILKEKYKMNSGKSLFDYHVYVLCGDGDFMEGISAEAISFAGTHHLDNLIVLYDSNRVSLDGDTDFTFTEDILKRCEASFWNTIEVDGEDIKQIDSAIEKAKHADAPTIIKCNTVIGRGSFLEGKNMVHGKPLTKEDISHLKETFSIPNEPFFVDSEAKQIFTNQIYERTLKKYQKFQEDYNQFVRESPQKKEELDAIIMNKKVSIDNTYFHIETNDESTRVSNGKIMNKIAEQNSSFIGGSADLSSSTMTYLQGMGDISFPEYCGKNIWFGVREHAMGAILNGLALTHFKPFGSTFMVFSDYLRPAIRLAALMHLPVFYIFTHDSIEVGEDGPTHEPIEQLASLRAIPNVEVFRPCDTKEIIGAWNCAFSRENPSVFSLSRGNVPLISNSDSKRVSFGAYIIKEETGKLDGTLVASGTEVCKALEIADMLSKENNLFFRVVSMPCLERFKKMDTSYQTSVLGNQMVFVLEAGSSFGLEGIATSKDTLLTIDSFGKSGKKKDVMEAFSFTSNQLKNRILAVYGVQNEK